MDTNPSPRVRRVGTFGRDKEMFADSMANLQSGVGHKLITNFTCARLSIIYPCIGCVMETGLERSWNK
jgi:hypothetical protein